MASRIGPRSVKDATRFTSTIPHATSKAAGGSAASAPKISSRIPGETPEQRVRRLRQAHLAAQKAQISKTDKFIDASRRFLDVAHRWTVGGIVIFTAVAGVVSIYSVWDMLRYNRARRAEWVEAQKQLEADELASARLAYLKGVATEEQIELVEEANREAEARGTKLPPLLAAPTTRTHFEEHVKPAFEGSAADGSDSSTNKSGKGVLGVFSNMLGRGEQGEDIGSSQGRLGYESLSEEDDATGVRESDLVRSIENKVRGAWEKEKENQRRGGELDQMGLETAAGSAPTNKSWWRFW
ncbi:cytochrome oxidase c assembly-domain-containing protein [Mariannaea sp. PMI_226]|nr:cytochrome oxidase c assembly-domain-containing protein [Mariannaea sp. PMI_226]